MLVVVGDQPTMIRALAAESRNVLGRRVITTLFIKPHAGLFLLYGVIKINTMYICVSISNFNC